MFEEDHSQSPTDPAPKKRVGTAVMLAAGGVVVATLFATVASMLAATGHEANPEREAADIVETITSVAPDGSTSTVLVTVPSSAGKSSAKRDQDSDRKQAARPNEQPKPGDPAQPPQLTTNPTEPSQTHSNPPTSWSEPPPSSSSAVPSSSSTAPSTPSSSSSTPAPPKP